LYYTGVNLLFTTAGARELLKRLEEVFMAASQGAGEDYLAILSRSIQNVRETDALDRLRSVRLAIARYFAAL
jgi:nuclear pore complex protein Nup85